MRLKPAIIILTAFAVVIAGLAALLVIYREPGPEQGGPVKAGGHPMKNVDNSGMTKEKC